VLQSTGLVIDESLLTGESEPVDKAVGALLLSGSFVSDGAGYAQVTAVGAEAYAHRLTAELKRHSLVRSELRRATNRILVVLSWLLGPLIVLTVLGRVRTYGGFDAMATDGDWRLAVLDSVASVVGMIPEGLVLLISLAFGVAAIQLARTGVLVQELAAVEVLARVDVLCLDKTGTLTSGHPDWDRLVVLDPALEDDAREALGAFGADDAGNVTAAVIATVFPAGQASAIARVPFSSSTKVSGVTLGRSTGPVTAWLLGAPEKLLAGHPLDWDQATRIAATGHRTLALVRVAEAPSPAHGPTHATDALGPVTLAHEPAALLVFRESIRPEAADTLTFFRDQGVRVIVLSGDNPVTVGAVAQRLGLTGQAIDASTLPDDSALTRALGQGSLFGRVTPEQKRRMVALLQDQGRTVAMTGDGVNDALAIKDADLGIAMGTATAATKAASRVVLLDNRFDRLPGVLRLGRQTIANVERVANLFLSKTVYGIVLSLAFAALALPFPFLPRQFTLVSSLAIGIPAFVLALAPNRRVYTPGVLSRIVRYAVPSGLIAAVAVLATYLPLYQVVSLDEARSVATVVLFMVSLWIVSALSRPLRGPRVILVAGMGVLMVLAATVPVTRTFFVLDLHANPALLYGVAVGVLGGGLIEISYRVARRRGIVFDRQ